MDMDAGSATKVIDRDAIARAIPEAAWDVTVWDRGDSPFFGAVDPANRRAIITAVLAVLADQPTVAEVKAEALREFARKWTAWITTDAPQVRGGAAYRANAEADAIARGGAA